MASEWAYVTMERIVPCANCGKALVVMPPWDKAQEGGAYHLVGVEVNRQANHDEPRAEWECPRRTANVGVKVACDCGGWIEPGEPRHLPGCSVGDSSGGRKA